ncbi:MAG: hypothetical protein LBO62_00255 [Endomicrobium sp.]|jgi:hypothetical protein|nr:hypothetical protein [Endomicrobium sp.]
MKIPEQYGKITGIKNHLSKTVIVNIQDLHCSPQAQRNIAEIIDFLDKRCKLKALFAEGAYGKVNVSWLDGIKDKDAKNLFIETLIKNATITASEYFVSKSGRSDILFGLEDEEKHKENLARLSYILRSQTQYAAVLKQIKERIDYLNKLRSSRENIKFNRVLSVYKNGKMSSLKFYSLIKKYVERINDPKRKYNDLARIKFSDYPEINSYLLMYKLNSQIDYRVLNLQMQSLISSFKNVLPYKNYRDILDKTKNFSDIPALSQAVAQIDEAMNLNLLKTRKELAEYFKLAQLKANINYAALLSEEKDIAAKIKAAFSNGGEENEISFLSVFYEVFEGYIAGKMTAQDLQYFTENFNKFKRVSLKYSIDGIKELEKDFSVFDAYYKLNEQRNEIFVKNIFKYAAPQCGQLSALDSGDGILDNADEIIAVVTGGYHSFGLIKLLEQKGLSSVVIAPAISENTDAARKSYNEAIKAQGELLKNSLSGGILSQKIFTLTRRNIC